MTTAKDKDLRAPWGEVLTYHAETTGQDQDTLKLLAADLRFTLDAARDAIDHKFENGLYDETHDSAAEQYETDKSTLARLETEFAGVLGLEVPPDGLVAMTFPTDRSMLAWLGDERNLEDIKRRYPPGKFNASVDLPSRKIIVRPN